MSERRPQHDPEWPRGFDEHELAQRRRLARLPLAEKLKWLEEAHRVVLALRRRSDEERGDG